MHWYGSDTMAAEISNTPTYESGLGSACAASIWRWAGSATGGGQEMASAQPGARLSIHEHQVLRVPREVLRLMAEAAWAAGRSEEEIWIEAAREWLRRRTRDDEPPPTAPAAAWPALPRTASTWAAIDTLVAELRPEGAAAHCARAS